MLAFSTRTLVLLLSSAVLLGATNTDARRILPKPILDSNHDLEPIAATATAPIYAHTQPPEQRIAHTIVHAHRQAEDTTKPLNDPSSVSSLLSRLSTATAANSAASTGSQAASATGTGTSSSSSIPFLSIGSEPTDFGSSSAATATATATAGGGGNGAAAALSVGSVKAGVVLAGALAAYMALGTCFLYLGLGLGLPRNSGFVQLWEQIT